MKDSLDDVSETEAMMRSKNTLTLMTIIVSIFLLAGCASQSMRQAPEIARISDEELQRIMMRPIATLSLEEIVTLSKQNMPATDIIEKIKMSESYYPLSPKETLKLSQQGVSSDVLEYMHSSHEAKVRNNVAEEINKRERQKVEEVEKLKSDQRLMMRYDPYWGMGFGHGFNRFGYGRFGPGFGWGGGFGGPFGYW